MRKKPTPSYPKSRRYPGWRKSTRYPPLIFQCFSAQEVAIFTLADESSWSFGCRSSRNGSVSLELLSVSIESVVLSSKLTESRCSYYLPAVWFQFRQGSVDQWSQQYLLHGKLGVSSVRILGNYADSQFSTLICVFTLDRIGRRWTLYWGSAVQGIAMFLCGGFTRLGLDADAAGDVAAAGRYGIAAASMIFIFTFTFGATWLTVPWLYPAEIFPLAVRAKGNAWGVVGWSIGNGWLVSLASPKRPC